MDLDEEIRKLEVGEGEETVVDDEEARIEGGGGVNGEVPKLRTKRSVSWGETKIMGEDGGQEVGGGSEGEEGK